MVRRRPERPFEYAPLTDGSQIAPARSGRRAAVTPKPVRRVLVNRLPFGARSSAIGGSTIVLRNRESTRMIAIDQCATGALFCDHGPRMVATRKGRALAGA
jgi:hypothetical protein